jgi:molybdopterin converting factor small subunit
MNTPEDYERALRLWERSYRSGDAGQDWNSASDDAEKIASQSQISCTVELLGIARLAAKVNKVTLALAAGATAADLFFSLSGQLPQLVGKVIAKDRRSLLSGHACNVNGRDFVRDPATRIHPGDCVFIISADAGG